MSAYALWCSQFKPEVPAWAQSDAVARLVTCSEYAARILQRDAAAHLFLEAHDHWATVDFAAAVADILSLPEETDVLRELRLRKHRYQVAFINAVVNQQLPQEQFLIAITHLAQALVNVALEWQFQSLAKRHGMPVQENGEAMRMVVLAMGKFGGGELNFSSDIDLIFAYAASGETAGGTAGALDHERFFRRLAQKLIYTLDSVSAEGFVYRVDMRLRPFGQSGALALNFEQMLHYYQVHGRDWERYAMMKARPVAGDIAGGKAFLKSLRPFMYRRYLDYPALHSLAEMKYKINQKIHEQGLEQHIKLGRGGIREAEFCVQALQLIYGGQYPRLQTPSFLKALQLLGDLKLWPVKATQKMREDYLLLRAVENALQFYAEQQTHQLPQDSEGWQRLALACGYDSVKLLKCAIASSRQHIHQKFSEIFLTEAESLAENDDSLASFDWQKIAKEKLEDGLLAAGMAEEKATAVSLFLAQFSDSVPWQRLPNATYQTMQKLLSQLLHLIIEKDASTQALKGVLGLINAVCGRNVYIELLLEQPKLLAHLLTIAEQSSWLMRYICAHPLVLDDVLSERANVDNSALLAADLQARLEGLDEEDWLHAIRDFKHAQVFKVAWADVHGALSLMQVSDNLSLIAELVVKSTLQRAYFELSSRYGLPRCKNGEVAQFAIIGYGKLGGLELGYGSDLDMVFIYDEQQSQGSTDGEKSIANQLFFTRLVQRLINYLTSPSSNGAIYEVDTRLRPSGKSGLVTISLQGFQTYQEEKAWIWEHQALVRARAIAGDAPLCAAFEALRKSVLCRAPAENLLSEVQAMREKMLAANAPKTAERFDVKQSRGGLIDIEFLVQYLLLAHAHDEPVLVRMSDNIRQLAALEATGYITSIDAMTLRDSYRRLRMAAHHRFLNQQTEVEKASDWQGVREAVERITQKYFPSAK